MNRDQWIYKNNVFTIDTLIGKTKKYIANKHWYEKSNAIVKQYYKHPNLFIDILAITSPRCSVKQNCINAMATYDQITNNKPLTVSYGLTHANTKKNIDSMLTQNVFGGQKVNAFSNALKLKDYDNVVIDIWILKAFNLKRKSPTKNDVTHITAIIKEIAIQLNLKPYQAQACLWVYAKTELNKTTFKDSYDFSYYLKANKQQTKLDVGVDM